MATFSVEDDLQSLTANGNTNGVFVVGPVRVTVQGTWGSGATKVQEQNSDGAWRDVPNTGMTANDAVLIQYPPGAQNYIRVNLSGASGPSLTVITQGATLR